MDLRHHVRAHWKRLAWLFAVLGPGVITSNVDNDAGGIYTYSVAARATATRLLWMLVPVTVALVVVQEMCSRMGTVTGKGLADLIREHFGLRITFLIMMARARHELRQHGGRVRRARLEPRALRGEPLRVGPARGGVRLVAGGLRQLQVRGEGLPRRLPALPRLPVLRVPRQARLGRGRRQGDAQSHDSRSTCRPSRWSSASSARRSRPGCSSTCSPPWSRRRARSPTTAEVAART